MNGSQDEAGPGMISLSLPDFLANPYAYYDTLLDRAPVFQLPDTPIWLVSRHGDCSRLLSDATIPTGAFAATAAQSQRPPGYERLEELGTSMLASDPPDHTRLRGLVSAAFTPRSISRLTTHIESLVHELLDRVQPHGQMELMQDFAFQLPALVIAELLGVPTADRERFKKWSNAVILSMGLQVQEVTRRAGLDAQLELATYFDALLAERRENPREDLMTDLLRAQQEGDRLSAQEVVSTCILLLIAGHETTTNLIGNGMLTLLEHPDALSHLRDHPDQMRSAVEEMMRFTAPVQRVARRTDAKPVQVGETTIPPGQFILLLVAAANRDPRVFVEPQTFDISRDPNPHLGFGRGIHFCIGAPLARLEAEISFRILLERLPRVRRADDAPLSWLPSTIFHGLRALPLAF